MKNLPFLAYWLIVFILGLLLFMAMVIVIKISGLLSNPLWMLAIWPLVFAAILFSSRFIVDPEQELGYEMFGNKQKPLENGWYFLPVELICRVVGLVPRNVQTLNIFMGERTGLTPNDIEKYVYGSTSNVEPETGDYIRLKFRVEVICRNSSTFLYRRVDPYSYVVSIVERYLKSEYIADIHHNSEYIIDNFAGENWENLFIAAIRSDIIDETGLEIIQLIPDDILLTPAIKQSRRELDEEKRKKPILEEKLKNKRVMEDISKKDDDIRKNTLESIKDAGNVNGAEALKALIKLKTLETVADAAKDGSVTYIDENGGGNLAQGTALGFGLRTNH